MRKVELLSPVGDFECLKAAVQNGANAVYLGASSFNARAKATNFTTENLKEAINYAKLRNVSVNLTLNTLIKNEEFEDAVNLAITAYNAGVDAIIIQDLGLASYLRKNYPEIPLHASTQMTVHNLDGVKQLETLGFSRVVLSRELSLDEIKSKYDNLLMNFATATVNLFGLQEPLYVDKESYLVKTLVDIFNKNTGLNAKPIAIGGGTYARAFKNFISYGATMPGDLDMCHQVDEFIEIDKLILSSKIYAEAIYELAK